MMRVAAQTGVAINDFWGMTPAELGVYAEGYAERLKVQVDIDRRLAYLQAFLTSRWVWQKRVDIDKYLETDTDKKLAQMSDEQMMAQIIAINAQMGGKVIKKEEGGA